MIGNRIPVRVVKNMLAAPFWAAERYLSFSREDAASSSLNTPSWPAASAPSSPASSAAIACEADVDLLLNHALARVPPDSSIRIQVWRA